MPISTECSGMSTTRANNNNNNNNARSCLEMSGTEFSKGLNQPNQMFDVIYGLLLKYFFNNTLTIILACEYNTNSNSPVIGVEPRVSVFYRHSTMFLSPSVRCFYCCFVCVLLLFFVVF